MTELRQKMIRAMELISINIGRRSAPLLTTIPLIGIIDRNIEVKMTKYTGWFIENHAFAISQPGLWCRLLLTRLKYYTHIVQSCQIVAKRHRTFSFYP